MKLGLSSSAGSAFLPRREALQRAGEDAAAHLLMLEGLHIVERNWRCRLGEIDIIAAGDGVLVFCEVKCRRNMKFGDPIEAVGPVKQARLRRLAQCYLAGRQGAYVAVQFDVVAVLCADRQLHARRLACAF